MISSRHRDAKYYRSEGTVEDERIKAATAIIIARSKRDAALIVTASKEKGARIFNKAYTKAPDFINYI